MSWSEIPLLDYIELSEEQCDVYVHTKDQRVIGIRDVQSNGHLNATGFTIDHMAFGLRFTFFIPREDFSHLEYRYSTRQKVTKKDFDDLYSYLDEDVEYDTPVDNPSESLTEPSEHLFEDLI